MLNACIEACASLFSCSEIVVEFPLSHRQPWAWQTYSHLSNVQLNPCNETGSGTASLELSSVNHLLGCMNSCGVHKSGPCMDMFQHDRHDINVHREMKKKKIPSFLSNGKLMWGEHDSVPFMSNPGSSALNKLDSDSWYSIYYACTSTFPYGSSFGTAKAFQKGRREFSVWLDPALTAITPMPFTD